MNNNIFRYELGSRWKSVTTWSFSLAALILVFFSIFPSFAAETEVMSEMLDKFPPELKAAFGMTNLDLSTVMGYYSLCFVFCQLILAIQAANYGFGLVSNDENELTADFLLSKPVSRNKVMTSKILAAFTSLAVTQLGVWVLSLAVVPIFIAGRPYEPRLMVLLLVSMSIFQLFFLSVGLLISVLVRRVRSVTPYSLGLAFGMYVLNAFSGVFGDVKLEYLTPFKHFDAATIVMEGKYNQPLLLLEVSVIILSIAFSYLLYIRRDIPAPA